MNKKLIAVAVSTAIAAPVTAQAVDVELYGRINNGISVNDITTTPTLTGGTSVTRGAVGEDPNGSDTDVSALGSRFGIRASSDLGNGLTATAQFEFDTNVTDRERSTNAGGVTDLRIGTVGLSGAFGSVTIGNQTTAFSSTVGTFIDPTYSLGGVMYSTIMDGIYRGSNTIKYSNSAGPVYFELDLRLNDEEETTAIAEKVNGNGYGLGLQYNVGAITLAAAYDSEDTDVGGVRTATTERIGVAINYTSDYFFATLGWHDIDLENAAGTSTRKNDHTQLWLGTNVGDSTSLMIGYGYVQDDLASPTSRGDVDGVLAGVYHNMGGGLRVYAEVLGLSDDATGDDPSKMIAGMRFDF